MSSTNESTEFSVLIRRAREGDDEARSAIFRNYRDGLLFVASQQMDKRVQGKCGASDIVQNTLLNATAGIGDFRGETEVALRAWLNEILRNEIITASRHYLDAARRDVRREQVSASDSQFHRVQTQIKDSLRTPASEAIVEEDAMELRAAIQRLPEDYRDVLLMRNWERMSFQAIARRFERSENSVKKLWARALARLELELFDSHDSA